MVAYYNEIEPSAAAWLRELIKQGLIADGIVDTRSITDVQPADLKGYTQCHFFAGIGVWSYALRSAGWPDSRPVWTGSCPCQPFSSAGKRKGKSDERHLWPAMFRLIRECRPPVVFGEQVASADGLDWLDSVSTDLESADYATAAADLCAAGTGAPHIRQRLYWVADTAGERRNRVGVLLRQDAGGWNEGDLSQAARGGSTGGLADASEVGWGNQRAAGNLDSSEGQESSRRDRSALPSDHSGANDGLADADNARQQGDGLQPLQRGRAGDGEVAGVAGLGAVGGLEHASISGSSRHWGSGQVGSAKGRQGTQGHVATAHLDDAARGFPWSDSTKGFWANPDWIRCRDGKWRCVEPGTFPLVDGAAARVGRLRGYGNAIVPQVAEAFIRAFLKCQEESADR